jgi:hypothetical protein
MRLAWHFRDYVIIPVLFLDATKSTVGHAGKKEQQARSLARQMGRDRDRGASVQYAPPVTEGEIVLGRRCAD